MAVQLRVSGLGGQLCEIQAQLADTILSVKEAIQVATGIPAEAQKLVVGESIVEDLSQRDLLAPLKKWLPRAWPGERVDHCVVRRLPTEAANLQRIMAAERQGLPDLSTRDELLAAFHADYAVADIVERSHLTGAALWTSLDLVRKVLDILMPKLEDQWVEEMRSESWRADWRLLFEPVIRVLQRATAAVREDVELVMAVLDGPWAMEPECMAALFYFLDLPPRITADRAFILRALTKTPAVFWVASAELRTDPEVIYRAAEAQEDAAHRWERLRRRRSLVFFFQQIRRVRDARRSAQAEVERILVAAPADLQEELRSRVAWMSFWLAVKYGVLAPIMVFLYPYSIFCLILRTFCMTERFVALLLHVDLRKPPEAPVQLTIGVYLVAWLDVLLSLLLTWYAMHRTRLGSRLKTWDPVAFEQMEYGLSLCIYCASLCGCCCSRRPAPSGRETQHTWELGCWERGERLSTRLWGCFAALRPCVARPSLRSEGGTGHLFHQVQLPPPGSRVSVRVRVPVPVRVPVRVVACCVVLCCVVLCRVKVGTDSRPPVPLQNPRASRPLALQTFFCCSPLEVYCDTVHVAGDSKLV